MRASYTCIHTYTYIYINIHAICVCMCMHVYAYVCKCMYEMISTLQPWQHRDWLYVHVSAPKTLTVNRLNICAHTCCMYMHVFTQKCIYIHEYTYYVLGYLWIDQDVWRYLRISQYIPVYSEYPSIFIEPATFSGTFSGTLPLLALNPEHVLACTWIY